MRDKKLCENPPQSVHNKRPREKLRRNVRSRKPRVKPQNNRPKRVRNKKPLRGPRPRNRRVFKPKPRCESKSDYALKSF